MLTYVQHRRRVRMLSGNRLDDARAGDVINMVLERLWAYSWSFRKKASVLITVAPYSTGVASLDPLDPTHVLGTPSPPPPGGVSTLWDTSMIGRYVRISLDVGFYRIVDVDAVLQILTLEEPYAGPAFVDLPYIIFQHIYSLGADVDVTQSMAYWRKLSESTVESADRFDARRTFTSDFPWSFLYRGTDSSGKVLVEVRPVPSAAIPIRYAYLTKAPTLVPGTDDNTVIPIESDVLNYLAASEGLQVWCAEHPEAAGVNVLLQLANARNQAGVAALQEALYADLKKAGPAPAMHDIDEESYLGDEFGWDHDYGAY